MRYYENFDVNVLTKGMSLDEIKMVLRDYNYILDELKSNSPSWHLINLLVIRVREEIMKIEK